MIVQCPQCSTRFRLDPRRLSDRGARVTCSVCSHGFVVRPDDDVEELDPFASTKVDAPQQPFGPPVAFDSDTTAHEVIPPSFDLNQSPHETKTAVHMVAPASRGRAPTSFDDLETLVDPPSRAAMTLDDVSAAVAPGMPSHGGAAFPTASPLAPAYDMMDIDISDDSATAVTDDDVMSIDDDDLVSIEDEPTVDQDVAVALRGAAMPEPMGGESSRAATRVVQTPSLFVEPTNPIGMDIPLPSPSPYPGPSSLPDSPVFPDQIAQARTSIIQVPSLTRPTNEAHQQSAMLSAGGGMETFVGRIDPALMARAIPQQDDTELLLSGGLGSDGTYSPPQEPTRPSIEAFEGQTAIHDLQLGRLGPRRETRPLPSGLGEGATQDGVPRPPPPPDATTGTRFVRGATTVMLSVVLLALAVFALVRSGQLDTEVLRDPERIVRGDTVEGASGILGVQPTSMRSVLYPTVHGKILVFTGEVKNTSTQPVSSLEVIAEVRKQDDTLIGEARGSLGVVLSVAELARLETPEAATRAFAAKQTGPLTIAPGERVPFMVVISPAPRELRSTRHRVRLVQAAPPPVPVTAPALPAEPAPREVAPPSQEAPSFKTPDAGGEHDVMQNKTKMKAKRTKTKRKARDADDGTPSEPAGDQ
ncbi:MAG: zinc-ribbon domain-containing protein [Myxococcota bacterium]|nr:zinc-ribbon domain-containing protein [Myxococcota bacterium]